jgi:nucleotide-binding universal stress UspA family protein
MDTRGRTKIKKLFLGSVASGVVTYAPCTVMVVR